MPAKEVSTSTQNSNAFLTNATFLTRRILGNATDAWKSLVFSSFTSWTLRLEHVEQALLVPHLLLKTSMLTSLSVSLLLLLVSHTNSRTEPVCTNAQPALPSLIIVMLVPTQFRECLNARLALSTTTSPRQRPRVLNVETTSSKLLTLETTRFVLNVRTMLLSVSTNASLTTREN